MKLTEIQQSIIEAPLGPAIVTAGAGSGKTRVLTHRLAHLIANGIDETSIIALTFTNKAAAEMKNRVENLTGGTCNAFLGTFHAWCVRLLRKYIKQPYDSNFSIYNSVDTQKVLKEVTGDKDLAKTAEWHMSSVKNEGLTIEEYRNEILHLDDCDTILRSIEKYNARLKASNALDFDDLLCKTYELLETDANFLEMLQTKTRYILVDEFQDTNTIQYKIISRIAGKHKNIMVVGDEDQCIYTWRGASIENLAAFRRDFPDARIYKLEENFRSSKNIVSLANKLVANNYNRIEKVLFSNLDDGKIELKQCFDERDEARQIAIAIATEHHQNGVGYGNFAVLMRINALSRTLEEQFRTFNIPHIVWGGFKFYERAEIKSAINYLRILVNPRDDVALFDALNYPRRGIGESTIEKIKQVSENKTNGSFDTIMNIEENKSYFTAKAVSGIKNFVYVFKNLQDIYQSFGLQDLAGSLISLIGLDQMYSSKKEEDINRLENLYQLEHAIKTFAAENPTATLAQYLQSVSLISDTDTSVQGDSVVISTVHSAKGLEFKNVFIIGLEDGLFPLSRAKNSLADMEEERRLLYVAITRARENLNLSYSLSRYYQGERRWCKPSEFIDDCGLKIPKTRQTWGDYGFDED